MCIAQGLLGPSAELFNEAAFVRSMDQNPYTNLGRMLKVARELQSAFEVVIIYGCEERCHLPQNLDQSFFFNCK